MLRPYTTLTLSMRVPPNVVPERAGAVLKELLEAEPPLVSCADRIISLASGLHSSKSASNIAAEQGMQVTYNLKKAGAGWEAPAVAPWLEIAAENASSKVWLPDSPDSRTNVGQLMYRHDHDVRGQAFGKPACYLGEGGSIPFMGSESSTGRLGL